MAALDLLLSAYTIARKYCIPKLLFSELLSTKITLQQKRLSGIKFPHITFHVFVSSSLMQEMLSFSFGFFFWEIQGHHFSDIPLSLPLKLFLGI